METENKIIELLTKIEANTKYTANTMSFFKTLTWIGIVIFLFGLFVFIMAELSS